jgi:hypothetical protein
MIDNETELITIPWTPDLDMRKVMVANALSVKNFSGADPRTVDAFQRLLGPSTEGQYGIWPLHLPYGSGGISTCAMAALGLLRRAGVMCPDIQDGYHDDMGSGLNVAKYWAMRLHPRPAWVHFIPGLLPQPGDVIQVLGPMHVSTCIRWEEAGGIPQCVCIDGGQEGSGRLQSIHETKRPWVQTPTGATLGGRECDGWIDVDLLPYSGLVTVPVGWESVQV